jgi:hypothetical protein
MRKLYWGKQPIVHYMVLTKEGGYLRPHQRKLQVGEAQCFYFRPEDEGLFWLTSEKRERKRFDVLKEGTKATRLTKKNNWYRRSNKRGLLQVERQLN